MEDAVGCAEGDIEEDSGNDSGDNSGEDEDFGGEESCLGGLVGSGRFSILEVIL